MREKFSSIERVIGSNNQDLPERERKEISESMEFIFKNQDVYKKSLLEAYGKVDDIPDEFVRIIFFEREKTSEEERIIDFANKKTNELRKKYGLLELNIPLKNVYVVPKEAPWPKNFQTKSYYNPLGQFIVLSEERKKKLNNSNLVFAEDVLHEMMHFKSYNSIQKSNSDSYFGYRSGLRISKKNNIRGAYFGNLDEAVVEELTMEVINNSKNDPLFKKEVEQTNGIKQFFTSQKTSEGEPAITGEEYYMNIDQENLTLWSAQFGRIRERKILNKLIGKIYHNNSEMFKDEKEVFGLFAEAVMTGRIVRLGRLIDKTFGKGTFRKIAELDDNIDLQEEYIENLKFK